MPIKRYKPKQIVTLLRQIEVGIANGKTAPQACKEVEITIQTYYLTVIFLIGGLLGWLLVMKKKVLICTNCSAVVPAS